MTTRGEILDDAFAGIGIADWAFTLSADEQASAFRQLDRMMAKAPWDRLPYTPGAASPNRADVLTTPAYADEAMSANLSLRLAPTFGKTVAGEQRRIAREGLNTINQRTLCIAQDERAAVRVRGGGDQYGRGW